MLATPQPDLAAADREDVLLALGLDGDEPALGPRAIERVVVDGPVFAAGDAAAHLYLFPPSDSLEAGQVVELHVERGETGRPAVIERVVDGLFGEMEFVGRDEAGRTPLRVVSARTLAPTPLIRLSYRVLLTLPPERVALVDRRLGALTVERCRALALAGDAARATNRAAALAQAILKLAEDTGVRQGGGLRIAVRKTQQDLADEVGLTREVVNGRLNEWSRSGWIALDQGGLVVRDVERLRRYVELSRHRSREGLERLRQRIDAALAMGDAFRARNLALDALRFFPASAEIQHRAALACLRAGAGAEADALLEGFGFGPAAPVGAIRAALRAGLRDPLRRDRRAEADADLADGDDEDYAAVQAQVERRLPALLEDVLALSARRLKDAFWAAPPGPARAELGNQATAVYARAFEATRRPYVGVNAAAMALATGDAARAEALAREVLARLPADEGYWTHATRAEAHACCGDGDGAAAAFAAAASARDAGPGAIAATRLQLTRLAEPLGPLLERLLASLPQVGVAALSGHMMLPRDLDGPGQAAAAHDLAAQIAEIVRARRVTLAYGALAAGSDILLAEAVLAQRGAFHAVLPFRVDDFVAASVKPGLAEDGPDWESRAAAALAGAASLTVAAKERMSVLPRAEIDDAIRIANRRTVGLALLKADELCTAPLLLAVHDGQPAWNIAGTAHLIESCRARGVEVVALPCAWRRAAPAPKADLAAAPAFHKPVLFVWDADSPPGRRGEAASTEARLSAWEDDLRARHPARPVLRRTTRGAAAGFAIILEDCEEAISAAFALAAGERPVRTVLDFGPVLRAGGEVSGERVAKLDAADDLAELPAGTPVATEAFAAEARFAGAAAGFALMGRLAAGPEGAARMPLPSVPLYRAQSR